MTAPLPHHIGARDTTAMSKFKNPKPGTVTEADIERVIEGADAVDARRDEKKPGKSPGEVRFTMTLPSDTTRRLDRARKVAGGLTRLSWIRIAIAEKLARDGF